MCDQQRITHVPKTRTMNTKLKTFLSAQSQGKHLDSKNSLNTSEVALVILSDSEFPRSFSVAGVRILRVQRVTVSLPCQTRGQQAILKRAEIESKQIHLPQEPAGTSDCPRCVSITQERSPAESIKLPGKSIRLGGLCPK